MLTLLENLFLFDIHETMIPSRMWTVIVLVFLAALCNFFAQPNELFLNGNWLFGLIGYVPLYLLCARSLHRPRDGVLAGLLYGLISTLSSYFWLSNFGDYSLWTIGAVSAIYSIFYAAFLPLLQYLIGHGSAGNSLSCHKTHHLKPLLFAIAWTAFEFFKSRGYLAFPWNLAAFPFHNLLLLNQIVELAGVWIISFTVFLLQGAMGQLILSPPTRRQPYLPALRCLACAALMTLLFILYGTFRITDIRQDIEAENDTILVLLVQQNEDSWAQGNQNAALQQVIDLSVRGIEEAREKYNRTPDIVSWSETSLSYLYSQDTPFFTQNPPELSFRDYLRFSNTGLITGAPLLREESVYMNGVIHLNREGQVLGDYGKIHLIPFAEHIPLANLPFFSAFLENVIGLPSSGWSPGEGIRTLHLDNSGLSIGTPVCFEDSFSNITRAFVGQGADILLNLTNNSWSRTRSAQMQHFVSARYRAIENRRPLLRSTNSGVTSIILPDGSIQAEIPMFQPDYLLAELKVSPESSMTFYTRYGDWFAWFMALGLLGVLLFRRYVRNSHAAM